VGLSFCASVQPWHLEDGGRSDNDAVQLFQQLDTMQAEQSRKCRRRNPELNARILAACEVPGMSLAKVALAYGIKTNSLYGWRKLTRSPEPVVVRRAFVPIAVAPTLPAFGEDRAI